jgi:chromosomal replication initiator protein
LRDRSPRTIWQTALGQLELQVTRPNFETWLRNTDGLRLDGDRLVVGVPSDFAVEWLRSRMSGLIDRTVSQLLGVPAAVSFQVQGAQGGAPNGVAPDGPAAPPIPALDARLTFDSFTVVKSSRLAYREARRVAEGNARSNPLLLYGPPGLGKTHLLHAIGHAAVAAGRRVVALSGEAFVNAYGRAVRDGRPHAFRDSFEGCELFLLDDIGFLASRAASQEQFFHILDTFVAGRLPVVLTAEAAPEALGLPSRLRSRLEGGLCVELTAPGADERIEILRAKAASLSHPLPDGALQLIARQPYATVRELEGALNRTAAFADLSGGPLTPDAVARALQPLQPDERPLTARDVLAAVCRHFALSEPQLTGSSRARDVTYARHIAIYLLRCHSGRSLADIGKLLGGRDHSTVLHAHRRIERELKSLPQTRADVDQLERSLRQEPAA